MSGKPFPVARKPARAPSRADISERERFAKWTEDSLVAVRNSAQGWRNGLVAFISLVTTGAVIKGRDDIAQMPMTWHILLTVCIGGGLACAMFGLWQALAAEVGSDPQVQTLQEIKSAYGSLSAYEVVLASRASSRLRLGRRAVGTAVMLILFGIIATWWAPGSGNTSAAYVYVQHGNGNTCGALKSIGDGNIDIEVEGRGELVTIPLVQIGNMRTLPSCPSS